LQPSNHHSVTSVEFDPTVNKLNKISIVIPVYRGEKTLTLLLEEIAPLTKPQLTSNAFHWSICEVLLVHDCGPDNSDHIIEMLASRYTFIRPIWLSRNFGQHAATLAGMAGAVGDWVVTMDEDLQHNPNDIGQMIDLALLTFLQLVYAQPTNAPPHGLVRNIASRTAKTIANLLLGEDTTGQFCSYRLIQGEIARNLAAYCSSGVYLDVALRWIASRVGFCPLTMRDEGDRRSGYSYRRLFEHFSVLLLTLGPKPLRFISLLGLLSIILAILIAAYAIISQFIGSVPVQGWTSLIVVITFFSGCILTSLGVIAEYLAVTLSIAMGKPLYIVTTKPNRLYRTPS
jgi:glycosyltransferase involved in cell wall biosynthesis